MRIMTTRKLCFYTRDRKEKFETSGNRIIETCPDWAVEDDMFKAAVRAGILTCMMEMKMKEEVAIQEAAPSNSHEEKALAEEKAKEFVPAEEETPVVKEFVPLEGETPVVTEVPTVKAPKKANKKKAK